MRFLIDGMAQVVHGNTARTRDDSCGIRCNYGRLGIVPRHSLRLQCVCINILIQINVHRTLFDIRDHARAARVCVRSWRCILLHRFALVWRWSRFVNGRDRARHLSNGVLGL